MSGLTNKELKLIASFLDVLSDKLGNAGCNDWNFPDDWSDDERQEFVKQYHEYNGDPEEYDPEYEPSLQDYCAVSLLKHKIEEMVDE